MIKYFLVFTAFWLSCLTGSSQKPNGPGKKGKVEATGKIIGKVIDELTKSPQEYCNVALYSSKDSSLVTGGITTKAGEFSLEKVKFGNYYLRVNFIGYNTKFISGVALNKAIPVYDAGKIVLSPKSEVLKAFEVTTEREGIEYQIDKKVINVDKFYTATSGTAVDILENVPSVAVDAERNVTVRGSSGFTVLIDGRPTVMDAADALEQYPSSAIESIEIITNPSAKYDPEGTAGIINIITKKQKLVGTSGIANLNLGMYENYGADALVQFKKERSSWYVGLDYNHRARVGDQTIYNATTNNNSVSVVGGDGDYNRGRLNATARTGVDLQLSNKNFLLIEGAIQQFDRLSKTNLNYEEYLDSILLDDYRSINESSRYGYNWNVSTDYTHEFKGPDKKFTAQLTWSNSQGNEYADNELYDTQEQFIQSGIRNTEVGPNTKGQVRLNFENKISDSLGYELGYQGTYDGSSDEFNTELYDTLLGSYERVDSANRTTTFYRYIHAPYALVNGSKGKLGYQLGLRAEFTNRDIEIVGDPTDYSINRVDLFPTIHLSYELPKKHQIMASYSRRIQRPRPWDLEPYVVARDQWNYRSGNPYLEPEYIDALELGYKKRFGKIFFSSEVYYRYTHDKIERIRQAYPEGGPGVTLQVSQNVGSDQALGLEMMVKTPLFKWWEINLMGNFYDYRVEGTYTDVTTGTTFNFDNFSTNYTVRFNQTFKPWEHTKIQFNTSYNSPTVYAQGKRSEYINISAAVRSDIIPQKFSINVSAQNLFQTAVNEYESIGPGFVSRNRYVNKGPVVRMTLTYKLNNFKASTKGQRSSGGGGE